MASLIRHTSRLFSRTVLFNSVRAGSGHSKDPNPNNLFKDIDNEVRTNVEAFYAELKGDKTADPSEGDVKAQLEELGSLTGDQRHETLENMKGIFDPFDVGVHKQTNDSQGTRENPILVPTVEGYRLVGCVCEEDLTEVCWMTIHHGTKRQCNCGNWFQCVQIPGAVAH
ncbi:cytochrome c oxidase subunit 5B, mitochondrial-like [Ruditapes philippinarum]|uniref:cytochrome c oxidase subunit 5B, mitochondrial-like n=1 Tax=Ruditapes philippinarum TaxID=129788 RepID=UPI001E7B2C80